MWRSLLTCLGCRSASVTRSISTQAFATAMDKVQQQLQTTTERKPELMRHGRQLFENEVLEDINEAYTPELASKLCHAASQLRISPVKGQAYSAVVVASISDNAIANMDPASLARIIHSCLVLRSPYLYEVLFSYVRPLLAKAGTMNAVSTAVIINAYGRAGIHHPQFYKTLCDAATGTLRDPRLSIAHVANVAHALSRVRFYHQPLFAVLCDQAIRLCDQSPPIVAVTILDAFAEVNALDDELYVPYEQRLLEHIKELQAPLLASLLSCVVKAGRGTPPLMATLGERAIALAETYDSISIARTCEAYYQADVVSDEVFGALAERACKVATDFRVDEIHLVLNALSAFDLFDGELFPLLSSRFVTIFKQGGYINVGDAAGILASFAAVQERNDELIHVCTQIFVAHPGAAMDTAAWINALWACATLNVRNEAQLQLVDAARKNPSLLVLPTGEGGKVKEGSKTHRVLTERRGLVLKAYSIGG